jgi:malate synthase
VAHPDLVPVAMEVFDRVMPGPNQLDRLRDDVIVGREQLLTVHDGARTEPGLRENIRVGVQYIEAWLRGRGAVPLYNLMEDAATAEISRTQIWQWLNRKATLDDGRVVTPELFDALFEDELTPLRTRVELTRLEDAARLFRDMTLAETCAEFLTLPAYELID